MRLQQYYDYWSMVYELDVKKNINEVIDLTTKVKKISDKKWHFWVGTDSYTVKVLSVGDGNYRISFVYTDYVDNDISSITDKHTPFSVMDGVAVVMKEIIQENNPKSIEYVVVNTKKKVDMFKKVTQYILKKHSDIFGQYKLRMKTVDIRHMLPPDIPIEITKLDGMEFKLEKRLYE